MPLLLWMAVIFTFSSMPSNNPNGYGLPFTMYLERKGAHIAEYFFLALLLIRVFRNRFPGDLMSVLGLTFLSAIAYACSDEFHQLFVTGREGKISDVMIDFIGIALAGLLAVLFARWKRYGGS
jgi:VanZ family protein